MAYPNLCSHARTAMLARNYKEALRTYEEAGRLIGRHMIYAQSLMACSHLFDSRDVAIIIPVHNALEDVIRCLQSLRRSDAANCPLVIINDGSDVQTSQYLRAQQDRMTLIEHDLPRGYTISINEALKRTGAAYVVVANSDLIFPQNWLIRLFNCLIHADGVGIAGPLSNAASYQSIPFVHDRWEGFMINELPVKMTVNDFNEFIYEHSQHLFPQIPIANGFCMMIKRETLKSLNYFDDINFKNGYGEEDDFCYRAYQAGYQICCADDVYVYHAKSRSFGKDRRKELVAIAKKMLDLKYPDSAFAKYAHSSNFHLESSRDCIIQALIKYYTHD